MTSFRPSPRRCSTPTLPYPTTLPIVPYRTVPCPTLPLPTSTCPARREQDSESALESREHLPGRVYTASTLLGGFTPRKPSLVHSMSSLEDVFPTIAKNELNPEPSTQNLTLPYPPHHPTLPFPTQHPTLPYPAGTCTARREQDSESARESREHLPRRVYTASTLPGGFTPPQPS